MLSTQLPSPTSRGAGQQQTLNLQLPSISQGEDSSDDSDGDVELFRVPASCLSHVLTRKPSRAGEAEVFGQALAAEATATTPQPPPPPPHTHTHPTTTHTNTRRRPGA
jgi:hypothetical protein